MIQTATGATIGPTIGVDLGGTNLRVAAVASTGEVLDEEHEHTGGDFHELIAAIAHHASTLAASSGANAIGVGVAALIDGDGMAHYAPNLPMLRQAPLRAALVDATGLPVIVDNDANVAAWGEVCHGAARGARHALVITLGTGVGGGIVIDGRIFRGAHGFAAEVGHWQFDPHGLMCACGERGHWEAAASGTALGHLARARCADGGAPNVLARAGGDLDAVTGYLVGDSAKAGEVDGVAILGDYARQVALGFVGLANILDPEIIVVSGGLAALGDLLLDPIRIAFDHHLEGASFRPNVPIVLAELGAQAGVVGAAALARELIA
ncbi:MAG: ROK family protein [Acidimicrobiia bacterium]|nr:ROK family protein [Acidimicrobiia bacterium]